MIANRDDPVLINNLAFALANVGEIAEAEQVISGVNETNVPPSAAIALTATKGLICFRRGMIERGRQLYLEAMDQANKKGFPKYRARAATYLAREELLAGTEDSELALKRAVEEARRQIPELIQLLDRVLDLADKRVNGQKRGTQASP